MNSLNWMLEQRYVVHVHESALLQIMIRAVGPCLKCQLPWDRQLVERSYVGPFTVEVIRARVVPINESLPFI